MSDTLADLNKSIAAIKEENRLSPMNYPHKAVYLKNLCKALIRRLERTASQKVYDDLAAALED